MLWEHFALNEIMARQKTREISHWRDKRGHEVDFVLQDGETNQSQLNANGPASDFAGNTSDGGNVVLAQDVDHHFSHHYGDIIIRFENLQTFVSTLGFSHQMV